MDVADRAEPALPGNGHVLVSVGSTGSIGQLVVNEAIEQGFQVRAIVRTPGQSHLFSSSVEVVTVDFEDLTSLRSALTGVTDVVFTQGTYSSDPGTAKTANYLPVRNLLLALDHPVRVSLMTTVAVTLPTVGHDWKRRAERLLRASGLPYTIVRPGWFDANPVGSDREVFLQGDTSWTGTPADGVVSRRAIARTLVRALLSDSAVAKTLELTTAPGSSITDLDRAFADLRSDLSGCVDGVLDRDSLPLKDESGDVRKDLDDMAHRFHGIGENFREL